MNDRQSIAEYLGEEVVQSAPPPESTTSQPSAEKEKVAPQVPPSPPPPPPNLPNPSAGSTKQPLAELLKDPDYAKEYQSQVDAAAAAQLRGKERQLRGTLREEVKKEVEDEVLRQYFGEMDKDTLAQTLADDPNMAKEYGRIQALPPPSDDRFEERATVHGYALQVRSWHQRLLNSDLDDTVKSSLEPERFLTSGRGEEGFMAWTDAIEKAIVDSVVSKQVAAALETQFEAYKQDRLAEDERRHPGIVLASGTRQEPIPDLMANSSADLLERALEQGRR